MKLRRTVLPARATMRVQKFVPFGSRDGVYQSPAQNPRPPW